MTQSRRTIDYVVGASFGQGAASFTGVVALECVKITAAEVVAQGFEAPSVAETHRVEYHLVHLERLALDAAYPAVVARLGEIVVSLPKTGRGPSLVAGVTGIGKPLTDGMRAARLSLSAAVTVTSGAAAAEGSGRSWRVPRDVLASALAMVLQNDRLRIAAQLAEARAFASALSDFVDGNSSDASSKGTADALVLATAISTWWAESRPASARQFQSNHMMR